MVEEVVEGVELPVSGERDPGTERVEEGGGDALVDGVFGDIDEEEGEHVGEE